MNVSWRKRLWFSASLTTIILMGFSAPALCEDPSAGAVLELTKDDRQSLAILGEGVVGKALPAVPLHDMARLMPLREDEADYHITAGANKGTRQQAAISKAKGKKERNLWQRTIKGDATEFYSVDDGGVVNLISETDLKQNVITRYKPMLPIMFDGMKPGETSRVETAVSVYDLRNPTDLKYKGRLKVTHTYVGAYELTVPAGKYETVLIRSSYEGKVGPADVTDGGYVFYAPGVGIVASLERMHVTAFLFYDKRTKTPKVMIK